MITDNHSLQAGVISGLTALSLPIGDTLVKMAISILTGLITWMITKLLDKRIKK